MILIYLLFTFVFTLIFRFHWELKRKEWEELYSKEFFLFTYGFFVIFIPFLLPSLPIIVAIFIADKLYKLVKKHLVLILTFLLSCFYLDLLIDEFNIFTLGIYLVILNRLKKFEINYGKTNRIFSTKSL